MRSTESDSVRCLVDSLKAWTIDSLPAIEEGIYRAGADPIELVVDFQPWLREALREIGPNLTTVSPGQCQELISIIGRVIDAIERVYYASGQAPPIGLGHLNGLEDFLVALAFRSREGARPILGSVDEVRPFSGEPPQEIPHDGSQTQLQR